MQAHLDPRHREVGAVTYGLQTVFFLANELEREIARILGIGLTDYRAVAALMQSDSLTVGQLATAIGASYATTTALANRLEAAGRVRRERVDADQRKVRLRVTQDTVDEVLALMQAPMTSAAAYVDQLSADDQEAVSAFTQTLAATLDDHLRTLTATPAAGARTASATTLEEHP